MFRRAVALALGALRLCSCQTTKKHTVEQALRLMIKLRRQHEVGEAFGKFRWRGNLAHSRKGRGVR